MSSTATSLTRDLAVISDLKVASTQEEGPGDSEICQDAWKLAMLQAEAVHLGFDPSLAFVCVLDNHPRRSAKRNEATLRRKFDVLGSGCENVALRLYSPAEDTPDPKDRG